MVLLGTQMNSNHLHRIVFIQIKILTLLKDAILLQKPQRVKYELFAT